MGTLIRGWQLIYRILYVSYTTQKSRLDDSLEHSKQMSSLMMRKYSIIRSCFYNHLDLGRHWRGVLIIRTPFSNAIDHIYRNVVHSGTKGQQLSLIIHRSRIIVVNVK